ncbi:MAG: hypothetical protein L3J53_00565 [Proteobacteria bacterium]|nr:hypothetical protein [Pseudomonadota bacterium]
MKNFIKKSVLLIVLLPTISIGGWTSPHTMRHNSYQSLTPSNPKTVLAMTDDFHTCDNNKAGTINGDIVGDIGYKTLTAVVLAAMLANKQVAIYVDGCYGDRAIIKALRISQ